MQFSTTQLAALAAFLPALVSAHMQMIGPESVFIREGIPNAPLDPQGSDYPCMITTNSQKPAPQYPQGSSQAITLEGSAIHGGGSCQISITYDNPPTKASVFKVIKSFQGNCPAGSTTGNLLSSGKQTLPFNVPSDLPAGDAVVAWTWFNKIGNREMYMRCAPVKITGSAGSKTFFNSLPDILKANIKNIGADTCTTAEGVDITFPNPGLQVTGTGNGVPLGNCGSKVVIPVPSITKPVLIGQPTATTTTTTVVAPPPTATTTVIAPPPTTTTTVVVNNPQVSTTTKPGTQPTNTPNTPKPKPDDKPVQSPPPQRACTDGEIICTSTQTFAICDWGKVVNMGHVADGTECSGNKIVMTKRNVRFSPNHMRRRHNSVL